VSAASSNAFSSVGPIRRSRFVSSFVRIEMPKRWNGELVTSGGSWDDVGSVVGRHVVPGVSEEGYSVEFFDMMGNSVAVITLAASALRLPTRADRPTVRGLSV